MMDQAAATLVARKLIQAAQLFARGDPYPDQSRQTFSVWWDRVPEAKEVFESAVNDVVRANPTQLSQAETASALTYRADPELVALALAQAPHSIEALEARLGNSVLALVQPQPVHTLQFFIDHLTVGGDLPELFGVKLTTATDDERQSLYADQLTPNPRTNAVTVATINAQGDRTIAYERALGRLERCLNILRGCGCDFLLGSVIPVPHHGPESLS